MAELNQWDITKECFEDDYEMALYITISLRSYIYAILSSIDSAWMKQYDEFILQIESKKWHEVFDSEDDTPLFLMSMSISRMRLTLLCVKLKNFAASDDTPDVLKTIQKDLVDYFQSFSAHNEMRAHFINDIELHQVLLERYGKRDIVGMFDEWAWPALYQIAEKTNNDTFPTEFMSKILLESKLYNENDEEYLKILKWYRGRCSCPPVDLPSKNEESNDQTGEN